MKLQVEEDLVTTLLDLAHDLGSLGIEKLHTDLYERLTAGELIEKAVGFLRARKIQCNNYVLTHKFLLYARCRR